ncbi:MAG: hypothetical protein HQ503_02280 [Rhodospirillales bacterium]|nr:hypothetical protein [Rhodospirillales bacterium]
MRYAVKYHEVTGEWLVFDIGEGFELVGMHPSEDEAMVQAMKLEERSHRRAKWATAPMAEATPQAA